VTGPRHSGWAQFQVGVHRQSKIMMTPAPGRTRSQANTDPELIAAASPPAAASVLGVGVRQHSGWQDRRRGSEGGHPWPPSQADSAAWPDLDFSLSSGWHWHWHTALWPPHWHWHSLSPGNLKMTCRH
jgi:hypothetical protein